MNYKNLFFIFLFFSILFLAGCSKDGSSTVDSIGDNGGVKEIRVEAFQFGFDPLEIRVKQGDTVRLIATTRDVAHGLAIPDYGVNLYFEGSEEKVVEFVADKKGIFSFYCSIPCGSGHRSMGGKLIVE